LRSLTTRPFDELPKRSEKTCAWLVAQKKSILQFEPRLKKRRIIIRERPDVVTESALRNFCRDSGSICGA
jgi:hypothetical protein